MSSYYASNNGYGGPVSVATYKGASGQTDHVRLPRTEREISFEAIVILVKPAAGRDGAYPPPEPSWLAHEGFQVRYYNQRQSKWQWLDATSWVQFSRVSGFRAELYGKYLRDELCMEKPGVYNARVVFRDHSPMQYKVKRCCLAPYTGLKPRDRSLDSAEEAQLIDRILEASARAMAPSAPPARIVALNAL